MGSEHAATRLAKLCLGALVLALLVPEAGRAQVTVREEKITLPTYEVGPPEPHPIFYFGRAYQGAKGPVYPYPLLDKLSDNKRDKTYRLLVLENEYVRIGVLPEIGGRVFEAVDKTNGYDFVYRQHVVKPALIGMTGAWISGGVEWNIPHHHRATSFMPVDSGFGTGSDGSATIWVGEIELRHRMKWIVGLTLQPGSSLLKVTTRVFNRTPFAHAMLAFANVAVHANEHYQVFFPPSTEIATFHGKNQFSRWPVSTEVFNGQDYTRGVDVSWWKSHLRPTSFFAFESQEDFFGGYDHGRQGGIVFVGDHHVVTGKKMWTWGTGAEGKTWERVLTDDDGPYLELMVGAWSDNQPDYSWIRPGQRRDINQYWYPVRELGGLKMANTEAACDLVVEGGQARLAFNTTSARTGARCVLRAGERALFEAELDIDPARPFRRQVELPAGLPETSLTLELFDADGRALVRYAPRPRTNPPLPKPVTPPASPEDIPTVEELYLAGQRLEQFHSAALEPYPYYEEALRRDPSDVRANTALALLLLKRGLYREAEERLETAVARLTANYTRPMDGEAHYYLGLARRRLGKDAAAEDAFERAAWDPAWQAASLHELAEMAMMAGEAGRALDYANESLDVGRPDLRTIDLLTAIYRRMGRLDETSRYIGYARSTDPLDVRGLHEQYLIERDRGGWQSEPARKIWKQLGELIVGPATNRLELALDYANAGLWLEAAAVAGTVLGGAGERADPLSLYLLAYAYDRSGSRDRAQEFLRKAEALPPDQVFPHALEFVDVFEWAMRENPAGARAPLYLGDLLFDLQPERAMAAWEKSRELDPSLAVVHRNLGLAYSRIKNDLPAAVASLEKAVALNPKDARFYYELDVLYEAAGTEAGKRLARLEKAHEVVSTNDNALAREVNLLVGVGRASRALEILRSHHFHVWEGGGGLHGLWVEAHLAVGRERFAQGNPRQAREAYLQALEYPANLDVGPPSSGPGSPKIFAHLGEAHGALGQADEAKACYERAAAFGAGSTEQAYYRGLALKALGRPEEARDAFAVLSERARDALAAAPAMDFFEKFGERQTARVRQANLHYLAGLGLLGLGRTAEARAELEKAVSLDPGHREARRFLAK